MKVQTTCPVTLIPLYVSEVKPGLLKQGAKGDWGYSTKAEDAVDMGVGRTDICLRDMRLNGRKPRVMS
jgi:hypothetical protein